MERLEHHSADDLKINPDGVVPTMVHDGRPLHESGTICEYVDEVFPDPPLRPGAPYDRALMRNWVRHVDGRIHDLIVFNWRHAFGDMASKWSDKELAAVLARIRARSGGSPGCAWRAAPTRRRSARRRGAGSSRCSAAWRLPSHPPDGLVGGAYSIADIAAVPFVKRIEEEIAPDQVTHERHPLVAEWWSRIQARPAFARADIGPFTDRPVAP